MNSSKVRAQKLKSADNPPENADNPLKMRITPENADNPSKMRITPKSADNPLKSADNPQKCG